MSRKWAWRWPWENDGAIVPDKLEIESEHVVSSDDGWEPQERCPACGLMTDSAPGVCDHCGANLWSGDGSYTADDLRGAEPHGYCPACDNGLACPADDTKRRAPANMEAT